MKNEDKTTPLKKLGYGLKYTLVVAFAILAICALCFIFISITTYFAPPLQPMFDQERLGQLGDFLGGTLNPIFGFATVCLLLWSVYIQRKELSLTRRELKKSARALKKQVELATDEYNRKQIDESLTKLYGTLEELYKHNLSKPEEFEYFSGYEKKTNSFMSLKAASQHTPELKEFASLKINSAREIIDAYQDVNLFDIKTLPNLLAAIDMILDNISFLLQEMMQLTKIESIKNSRIIEIHREVEKFRDIRAISNERATSLLLPIKSFLPRQP